jgi:hypothetical protein
MAQTTLFILGWNANDGLQKVPNIKMQRTGATLLVIDGCALPAADLGR